MIFHHEKNLQKLEKNFLGNFDYFLKYLVFKFDLINYHYVEIILAKN